MTLSRFAPSEASVLAIDVGTSVIKAGAVAPDGRLLGLHASPQSTVSPHPGASEQDPNDVAAAAFDAIRGAAAAAGSRIDAVAVTGARGTIALLDGAGHPLTPFLTWQDRRGGDLLERVEHTLGAAELYRRTGNRLDPSLGGLRVSWLCANATGVDSAPAGITTPQTHLLAELGGDGGRMEASCAAYIGTLDLATRTWDVQLADAFGFDVSLLPEIVPPGSIVGQLSGEAADALGLRAGIPLVLAASDGVCAELGCGVLDHGELYGYLGTALAAAGPLERPHLDSERRLLVSPGANEERWRILGLSMNGAGALDWGRAITGVALEHLDAALARSSPGALGARFLPHLSGAGSPFWSPAARGAFVGLSLEHRPEDVLRAVAEGVAVQLRLIVDAAREFGIDAEEIKITGGGARSDAWVQVVADVLQLAIVRPERPEPGLAGAACYGLAALEAGGSVLDAARGLDHRGMAFAPDETLAASYSAAAAELANLHAALTPVGADGE